jgi:ATP-dependent RNA helicase DDX35
LHEIGWTDEGHIIACAQTTTTNCKALAEIVSEELATPIGTTVGYILPFEKAISTKSLIKYLPAEILLKELLFDPILSKYSVIIVDDVHERSLNSDILLGVLKK